MKPVIDWGRVNALRQTFCKSSRSQSCLSMRTGCHQLAIARLCSERTTGSDNAK